MQFRTVLKSQKSTIEIGYELPTLAFGSCFAENIGKRLSAIQISILINPFGILYNPISIAKNINYLMTDSFYTEKDIFQHDGLWHSKNHHGRFSSPQKAEILRGINAHILQARNFLKETKRLIITLGTAHVFVEKSTGEIVANCHKLPPQYFDKKRLSVVEIVENLKPIIEKLNAQLIDLEIIITVSPIRHLASARRRRALAGILHRRSSSSNRAKRPTNTRPLCPSPRRNRNRPLPPHRDRRSRTSRRAPLRLRYRRKALKRHRSRASSTDIKPSTTARQRDGAGYGEGFLRA